MKKPKYIKRITDHLPTEPAWVDRRGQTTKIMAIPAAALAGSEGIFWDQGPLTAYAAVGESGPWYPLVLDETQAWNLATSICQRTGRKAYVHTYTYDPQKDESQITNTAVVDRGGVSVART